jgi:cytochrome c-type biogenesis protein CcmH/NrfG
MGSGHMPSQQELRKIADKQALPLIEQLKAKPDDASLMVQIGAIYHSTRQYPLAIEYYGKAVSVEPRNAAVRNKLATSLYRSGDVDGAIAQLNQCLAYDSNDANSLFNLGVIRWEGKQDAQGAMAAWQRLLKSNPRLNADRKNAVKKMIAEVQSAAAAAPDPRSANQ